MTFPQWVLVNRDQVAPLEGQVTFSHLATDDNPIDHHSRDRNFFVYPDPAYAHLLADPGNFAQNSDLEHGRIEVEWESAAFPSWAFPMAGDKVHVEGSWIWDCAHGDHGYRTEIHPPQLVMTLRDAAGAWPNAETSMLPARPGWADTMPGLGSVPVPVTRADVVASSDGGEAREQETCFAPPGVSASCAHGLDWYQPLAAKDYTLFVPAPPKPDPGAHLVWRLVPRPFLACSSDDDCGGVRDVLAEESDRLTFTEGTDPAGRDGVSVHVNFTGAGSDLPAFSEPSSHLYGFGFTLEVGWNRPAAFVPRRVKVTIEGVHVANPLDGHCLVLCDFADGEFEISSLIGDTFKHVLLTGHGVGYGSNQDVPDTESVNTHDYGIKDSGPQCALNAPSLADPGPCQATFDVTLLPGQPLDVLFRAVEHDGSFLDPLNENDDGGTVEHIFTSAGNYGVGHEYTEWFQDRTSAGGDSLDADCSLPHTTPCLSVTYRIDDDPIPQPPAITLSTGAPKVVAGGGTWVTSSTGLALTANAASGHLGDGVEIDARFSRAGTTAPALSVCGSGTGTASCSLHLDANDGADGSYTVEFRAVDTTTGAREATQTANFNLDNTAPATTVSLAGTLVRGWYNSPVSVTLAAGDGAGVGVGQTRYAVDGGAFAPYAGAFSVSGDSSSHGVAFSSADKLGNAEAAKTAAFKIDGTAPALSIGSASDGTFSYTQDELLGGIVTNATSLSLSYAASDTLSGLYAVRLDGSTIGSGGTASLALPAGVSRHTLVAEDVAGNLATLTFAVVSVPPGTFSGGVDPQGAGFWEYAVSNGSYTADDIGTLLTEADIASQAFGVTSRYENATSANYLDYLAAVSGPDMDLKVRRELLVAWLNLVSGREPAGQSIDVHPVQGWETVITNTGGSSRTTALNLVRESERRLAGTPSSSLLETIKNLLETLNSGHLNR